MFNYYRSLFLCYDISSSVMTWTSLTVSAPILSYILNSPSSSDRAHSRETFLLLGHHCLSDLLSYYFPLYRLTPFVIGLGSLVFLRTHVTLLLKESNVQTILSLYNHHIVRSILVAFVRIPHLDFLFNSRGTVILIMINSLFLIEQHYRF